MLIRSRGTEPHLDASAFVAPMAVLVGGVSVGPEARIMYGAVLNSEASRVEVGPTSIICENTVLRATAIGDEECPMLLGDHVFVGPHATLLGCTVEPACYVATGLPYCKGPCWGLAPSSP